MTDPYLTPERLDWVDRHQEELDVARVAVEKGLAWLLESGPAVGLQSLSEVDVETLRLSSCTRCVLGQLAGGRADRRYEFGHAIRKIFQDHWNTTTHQQRMDWAAEHGFVDSCHTGVTYELLDHAWREAILKERGEL
jgi:hypothetical protein